MTGQVSARDIEGLVARLQHIRRDGCYCADKPNKASLLHPVCHEAAAALLALKAENDGLRAGFSLADSISCAAIENGFYVGDGVLDALASARAILRGSGEAG